MDILDFKYKAILKDNNLKESDLNEDILSKILRLEHTIQSIESVNENNYHEFRDWKLRLEAQDMAIVSELETFVEKRRLEIIEKAMQENNLDENAQLKEKGGTFARTKPVWRFW